MTSREPLSTEVIAAIQAEADKQYDKHPGRPLTAETAEPVRRLLPAAAERETAA